MIFIHIAIGVILGMFIKFVIDYSGENHCPRVEYGFGCRGYSCDHNERLLLQARLDMLDSDE